MTNTNKIKYKKYFDVKEKWKQGLKERWMNLKDVPCKISYNWNMDGFEDVKKVDSKNWTANW